jgi:hypothetical protein
MEYAAAALEIACHSLVLPPEDGHGVPCPYEHVLGCGYFLVEGPAKAVATPREMSMPPET